MRLLTLKLHRAFPELDRFDDWKAAMFVVSASRSSVAWNVLSAVACLATFFVATAGFGVISSVMSTLLFSSGALRSQGGDPPIWAIALALSLPVVGGGAAAFLVRDVMLRRQINRILGDQARCRSCRYELLGLKRNAAGMVLCPECGTLCEMDESFDRLAEDTTGEARVDAFIAQSQSKHGMMTDATGRPRGDAQDFSDHLG